MRKMFFILTVLLIAYSSTPAWSGGNSSTPVWRVLPAGELPADKRLEKQHTLNDAYHPWVPPTTMADWKQQVESIREQLLVSNGLWPLPPKTPLNAVIHGKIDRDDYTIEKVYFASHPGHYVTGNLYRPKNLSGKAPGILSPHGHWEQGRFYDAGDAKAKDQLGKQAEQFESGARYPVQARMAQLARMGCVVFHYDMVGYADSQPIDHREDLKDVEAGLRLQSAMGLQTWNSIRALDFLLSLPDVDADRIGVTGASGGGTQTFVLCAIDPRPDVAFPAVMVSTAMQGGCVCENAPYLRVGLNNVAMAAAFAPKPMAMSGADDWTIDIETKGLPELKQVYSLYNKSHLVHAKCFPQFQHNYNQVARELMFDWFNTHLNLNLSTPVKQRDFQPVLPNELSVFDAEHRLPGDAKSPEQLRDYLTAVSQKQFQALLPKSADGLKEYRRVVGTAARVMLDQGLPKASDLETTATTEPTANGWDLMKGTVGRKGAGEQIPFVVLLPEEYNGTTVMWFDDAGKSHLFDEAGQPVAAVQKLLRQNFAVASADVFLTGEFVADGAEPGYPDVDDVYHGYTFGYNRTVLSNRVRDILTATAGAVHHESVQHVHLVGTGDAGVWVLLARALAGDQIEKTIVDIGGFHGFGRVSKSDDPLFLPGALKYGGLGGLAVLAASADVSLYFDGDLFQQRGIAALPQRFRAGGGKLKLRSRRLSADRVAAELTD